MSGGSWGGPHSLRVAARLPERVTRAAVEAGVAPFGMPGFDWFADMDAVNIEELGWALEGEDVLAREIKRVAASDHLNGWRTIPPSWSAKARWSFPRLTVP